MFYSLDISILHGGLSVHVTLTLQSQLRTWIICDVVFFHFYIPLFINQWREEVEKKKKKKELNLSSGSGVDGDLVVFL